MMGRLRFRFTIAKFLLSMSAVLGMASPPGNSTAVIVNSGSTNTPGFRVTVESNGTAEYTPSPRAHAGPEDRSIVPMRRKLPPDLAHRLYSDLEAAHPFSDLPRPRCIKSVSFGTRLTIQFNGDETPDLNCGAGQSAKVAALIQDAKDIVAVFQAKP